MVKEIIEPYLRGDSFQFGGITFEHSDVADIEIRETPSTVVDIFYDFKYGNNVTDEFIVRSRKGERRTQKSVVVGKDVFIVHGRDHKPMEELKTMLYDFGLNPIVLHEKASGGLTLAEKLEKYSEDVGYAFIILTPDDVGTLHSKFVEIRPQLLAKRSLRSILNLKPRARQNVIFEMGYFWGLLKRKRVCCLLKGDVEKPSDIEGIVYIPFKDSVNEVREEIIKELKEARYEIKLKEM